MRKLVIAGIIILGAQIEIRAQSNGETWAKKFDAYQAVWQKVKLHLIFNQEKYSPGDTAFFKAYFLKEDLTPVAGKQLIDLSLVDSRGETKLHFMFNVHDGVGYNQLEIPDSLSTGIYLVTAYSSWMKNFDQNLIFKKKISIVKKNTLIVDEHPVPRAVAEGGHLIGEISNKISISTYQPSTSARIIDATGQEIQNIITDGQGMGSIIFIPARNSSYFLQTVGEPKVPLPKIEDDGCGILFMASKNGEPAKLFATSPPGSPLRNQELTVMLNARGKIVYTVAFTQGNKDQVELPLPTVKLPEGIVHVSILNNVGELLASRDFYSPSESPVHAEVQAIHKYYQTRERVKLEVSLTNAQGQPATGEFAVSVTNAGIVDVGKRNSLSDELTVLYGTKESFRIDRTDPNWRTSLDHYLISVTEEVPWKTILSNRIAKPLFSFTSVIQKSGKAYIADTRTPLPASTQVMLYLQRDRRRYLTLTSENGKIGLAIFDVFGRDELFYFAQSQSSEIPKITIEWEDDPFKLPSAPESRESDTPDLYALFTGKSKLINRSYGFYSEPEETDPGKSKLNISSYEDEIKGGADISVNIQDYILFPTMEELIKEVIPSLRTRKSGQKSTVRVTLPEPYFPMGDPLYIIDGIATRNTDFFLSFKPVDVLTVKIIRDHQKLGPLSLMGKSGIVIVQTKKGNAREPLSDSSKIIEGLSYPLQFKALNYAGVQNTRRPDFRSTIYWNPTVKTDANGKAIVEFFCSDDIGKLSISVDGIANGEPFSAGQELEVGLNTEKK